jgi:hypothetical protein
MLLPLSAETARGLHLLFGRSPEPHTAKPHQGFTFTLRIVTASKRSGDQMQKLFDGGIDVEIKIR